MRDRAWQQAGTEAFVPDEDDEDEDGEQVLAQPWSAAVSALVNAAMAMGAPELVGESDKVVLTAAWAVSTGHGNRTAHSNP